MLGEGLMIGIEPRVEVGDPHPVLFGLSTGGAGPSRWWRASLRQAVESVSRWRQRGWS